MPRACFAVLLVAGIARWAVAADPPKVAFHTQADRVRIGVGGQAFADYVFRDPKILRPYLAHVRVPGGPQVTRNLPPIAGQDATDHDTMHPGIWLAFGDLGGGDFWRNKGVVEHVSFVDVPAVDKHGGHFVVRNRYRLADKTICEELCRIAIAPLASGTLVIWDSTFTGPAAFAFGDQEEMGLGMRVATPLAVKNGGSLTNSDGQINEKQVWGKQADWCDYSGTIDGRPVGILLVPDAGNFRRSWFHARDYGFVAANAFGRRAFTKGEASSVTVNPGERLRLRYGVLVHSGPVDLDEVALEVVRTLAVQQTP